MIKLTLYLQCNSNGTFSLSERVDRDMFGCDYWEKALFSKNTRYAEVVAYAKYIGCKKLILDF